MKQFRISSFKPALLIIIISLIASARPAQVGIASVPLYFSSNQVVSIVAAASGIPAPASLPTLNQIPPSDPSSIQTFSTTRSAVTRLEESIRFAVIGDFGDDSAEEGYVADLVDSWSPDFVTTVGDNNYPIGAAEVIDQNIGQYYHQYIYPYSGSYGAGSTTNRFFPSIGNHDLDTLSGQPYFNYFNLPGNERYYDFVQGPVHFFMINSDPREADGVSSNSTQAQWLQAIMETSTAPWQIVIFHHAPYSSGSHGSSTFMRWPFAAWGADAVLTGHDHTYERLLVGDVPYFVNGLAGGNHYNFGTPLPESLLRYNSSAGAMLVEASDTDLNFKFYSISNTLIDSFDLNHPPTVTDTPSPSATTAVPTDTETVTPSPSDTVEPSVTASTEVPLDQFIYFLPIILVP